MRYRVVSTPFERGSHASFDVATMIRNLDDSRDRANAEKAMVFRLLPRLVKRSGRCPEVSIERSEQYSDSIALVVRERKKWLFVPYTVVTSLDLSVHYLTDLADELEFFVNTVVAMDAFERTSTSGASHGKLVMRCNCGTYQLQSSVHDFQARGRRAVALIELGLLQMQDLIRQLREFEVPRKAWQSRNFS